jgi:hypothetical protein
LNAIEIIDRNLYERTCDVRWWATDSAVVACAMAGDGRGGGRYASERLKRDPRRLYGLSRPVDLRCTKWPGGG